MATITNRFEVDQFGTWTTHGTLRLTHRDDHWFVDWSPQEVERTLREGEKFVRTLTWPTRASILGAGGVALTSAATMVTVGLQGSRVKDGKQITTASKPRVPLPRRAPAGATAAAHPTWFVPVFELPGERVPPVQADDLSHPRHGLPDSYGARGPDHG